MSNVTHMNRSPSDALSGILERLNGTVAKVTKLRRFLRDLKSELNEICEECENEIHARTVATDEVQMLIDKRKRDVMKQSAGPVSLQSRKREREPILTGRDQKSTAVEQEADKRTKRLRLEPIPNPKSKPMKSDRKGGAPASIPGGSFTSAVSGGSKLPEGANWLSFRSIWSSAAATPRHVEIPSVPQPPYSPPFPEDISDLSCYPPELKHEGPHWFILFNPSPKVKRLIDVKLVHTLMHGSGGSCVRFSRNGKWLATGGRASVQVYDAKTGVTTCILDHGSDVTIRSLCFSPDGKYLATGAQDKQVRVWNIANNQCDHILEGHQGTVHSVDFSPNGRFIVSGSIDGTMRIWDVHDWTSKVLTIDDHYCLPEFGRYGFFSVAISPDGMYVAAGSRDTVVRIWEMTTGGLVQNLRGHRHLVCSVVFTPDGKGLLSGSRDRILKYWDVSRLGARNVLTSPLNTSNSSSSCLMNITDHTRGIHSISVSHDGTWVVSGSDGGRVLFWDLRTGVVQLMLSGHKDSHGACGVDLSPTGDFLATTGRDGHVRIWNYGAFG